MSFFHSVFFLWHVIGMIFFLTFGHMEDISDFAFVLSRRCYLYMKEPKGLRSLCCTNLIFQLPLAAQQDNPRLIGLKIILCHLSKFCVLTRLSWRLLTGVSPVIEDRQSWSWGLLETWLDIQMTCSLSHLPPHCKGLAGQLPVFLWDFSLTWHAQHSTVDGFSQSKSHKVSHNIETLGVTPGDCCSV